MPNITLSIDEDLLKAGRRYAEEHHTSLNTLVRDLLAGTVMRSSGDRMDDLFRQMDKAKGNSKGWKWNREDAYDV